jgi:CRP/FNR family transcriptional regulator, cyclic AMP receptor protein
MRRTSNRPSTARQPHTSVRAAVGASPHFRGLPAESLDRLAAAMSVVRLSNGQLVRARDTQSLWFVVAGALRLSLADQDDVSPTLAVFGPGSFYNVAAFLGVAGTPTECHAIGATMVGKLGELAIKRLLAVDPALVERAGKLLVDRLTATLSLYNDVISAPLPQRLARRLLTQALTTEKDHGETEVRLSQGMLAQMVGASRTRISEELHLLEKAKVLRLGYRRLFIRDMARLCELAGPGVLPM